MGRISIAVLATAALALGGCGGGQGAPSGAGGDPAVAGATIASPTRLGVYREAGPNLVATVKGTTPVDVRTEPDSATKPDRKLDAGKTPYGTKRAVLVLDRQGAWLFVALPTRPNGGAGWVPADRFELTTVADRITVDLAKRTITLVVDAKTHTGPVAIGSMKNPTPTTGRYPAFVTDTLSPGGGAYGKYALGISLHSETLTEFGTGDAQVGIHGTNEPKSIGQAVSHGCIRVNTEIEKVLATVKVGTPVIITG